ncbi:hypothetical protein EHI8A_146030 [Entamoeba histolytica HM-1:IMSS-B]|uniref:Uncharacterized protein n=6 Tax=Entamoeba histolytica TaxID=5759 RepID=C4LVU8_ENTH1|nr:hypothetical protein EHI_125600 [Entamoeba histolytica HM-1:IMSS]EMD49679.1 Hypothetical protein EHI5A_175960 [Entamoeba histolytica KU27]EMH73366.1 hypothetical protein EHI8A_146030 [Entamoeba histolytica HM-1:IMSS-B]EMS13049.1 hypothetical protein KM1_219420 [Entamoeba histolytica HM-3:IMSS]ENY63767.1 hypothetical protein EHI7A_128370 [Entamoeba histolytica HM-1:IMSS-A]GAT92804.1 hypothetical protein CL6EHI_125600 [Entamoeba histolytica]|eukprot:XP_656519.1 hypothetical protein EHI_125600 [Entamoeba histolytica HM-1:IMSS]
MIGRTKTRPSLQNSKRDPHSLKSIREKTHQKNSKCEAIGLQTFFYDEDNERLRQKKLEYLFSQLIRYVPQFNKEAQIALEHMLQCVLYAMKYEPTLRIGFEPYQYDSVINTTVITEMQKIIQSQEEIINKLTELTERFNKSRLTRFSVSAPNCDLSAIGNESLVDTQIKIPDILDYCSQYMMTTNHVLDYVANANAQLDRTIITSGDFTVYEDLLNAVN